MRQLTRKDSKRILLKLSIVYIFACPLLALLTPDNVMEWQWARSIVGFMEYIVPLVSYIVRCGPEQAVHFVSAGIGFIGVLYWALFAYVTYQVQLRGFSENCDKWGDKIENLKKIGMLIPVILIVSGFVWIFYVHMPKGICQSSLRFAMLTESKLGMGTYGAIVFFGAQMFAMILLLCMYILYCLLRVYFATKRN